MDLATAPVLRLLQPPAIVNRLLKLLLVLIASVSIDALAKPNATADEVVSSMTQQVLAQAAASGPVTDQAKLKALIESTVLPHIDFRGMTARAVGPKWRSATDEQKSRLMAGFEAHQRHRRPCPDAGGASEDTLTSIVDG